MRALGYFRAPFVDVALTDARSPRQQGRDRGPRAAPRKSAVSRHVKPSLLYSVIPL